jgi:Leucine-rich repeat (LRR) protein
MKHLLIGLLLLPLTVWSQPVNIDRIEYLIDTDLGTGNGIQIAVPAATDISNFSWAIDLSRLTNGLHLLHIRSRTTSGVWSGTHYRWFLKVSPTAASTLVALDKVEYFVDSDPGNGNGTNVPITAGTNLTNINWNMDMTTLTAGWHTFFVRTRTIDGVWSLTHHRTFYKAVTTSNPALIAIDKVEYCIDTDPGLGNATNVPITAGTDVPTVNFNVDMAPLSAGWHVLYARSRNVNGVWSFSNQRTFYKSVVTPNPALPNIDKFEYFVDTDPGLGNGINVPVTAGSTVSNLSWMVDVTVLSAGWHVLYERSRSMNGVWSETNQHTFYKAVITPNPSLSPINKLEYFVDTDPGLGNGINVPVTAGTDLTNINFNVDVSALSEGWHVLYERTRTASGQWSVPNQRTFYKAAAIAAGNVPLNYLEYFIDTDPGQGSATSVPITTSTQLTNFIFPASVNALDNGFHTMNLRVRNGNGAWSSIVSKPFYKTTVVPNPTLATIQKVEYFLDTDPGFGNGTNVPVTAATQISNLSINVNTNNLSSGTHKLYVRSQDANNLWSLISIQSFQYNGGCGAVRDSNVVVTLCGSQTYPLPSGRGVVSATGVYRDTLRYASNAACDSVRFTISVTNNGCRCQDSLQLVTLHQTMGGSTWANASNWLTNNPLQTWYGVTLNATGCVSRLNLGNNQLKGRIPTAIQNLTNLDSLVLKMNRIDSFPDVSNLTNLRTLDISNNRLTYDDILPNIRQNRNTIYAPQDSIFKDTTYTRYVGDAVTIDLGIDVGVPNNVYTWYKNGNLYRTTNYNQLIINNLQLADAGIYTCRVTNPNAPNLTLYSRQATLSLGLSCRTNDSLALVQLYRSTRGATAWNDSTNWLTLNPISTWYGVQVNTRGCVDSLGLSHNNLIGKLPTSIGDFSNLQVLELANNELSDTLPNTIGNLRQLRILLASVNGFTGKLPATINNLNNLQELYLTNNNITKLPVTLSNLTNLTRLELDGNRIDSFPNSIGQLTRLTHLHLAANDMAGTIPNNIGNLTRLQEFHLFKNRLTGNLPATIGNLTNLKALFLNDNQLSGNLPVTMGNFFNLKELLLQNNQLVGAVPTAFQNLRALTYLNLASNRIESMPTLTALSLLTNCLIDSNRFTFANILPNLGRRYVLSYSGQDSVGRDTVLNGNLGSVLTLQLAIDSTLSTNQYAWSKNGILLRNTIVNQLVINPLRQSDTGTYTVRVTNPSASGLTLNSRKMKVQVNCNLVYQTVTRQICQGRFYILPSGRRVTQTGIYRDTFPTWLSCDSIIVTNLTVNPNDTMRITTYDCTLAQTIRDTTILPIPNRYGCDSMVIRTRVAARNWTELPFQYSCNPRDTGSQSRRLTNRYGCDSIVNQRVVLAPSYQIDSVIWVCDPSQVRKVLVQNKSQYGCDSLVNIRYALGRKDSTIIMHLVCDIHQTKTVTRRLTNRQGCDSIVEDRFRVLKSDKFILEPQAVCDTLKERVETKIFQARNGCDSLEVTHFVFDNCVCLKETAIYNGLITNDGDRKNDVFIIEFVERYQPNDLIITDQRGMTVFQTQNYRNKWNGTNLQGQQLPEGVYNYVFRTIDPTTHRPCRRIGTIDLKYIP